MFCVSRMFCAASLGLAIFCSDAVTAREINISLGAKYSSNLSKRGMTLYDSHQVIPIYAIDFGSPDFVIVGSGLYFRHDVNENVRFRSILLANATGDQPLYETGGVKAAAARSMTHEWDNVVELSHPDRGEISVALSQDLKAHRGRYLQVGSRVILGRPMVGSATLEPALFGFVGGGTESHNRYLYGANAVDGLAHYEYGVSLSLPPNIDRYFPVLAVKRFGILGAENKGAELVQRTSNTQFVALFAFKVI